MSTLPVTLDEPVFMLCSWILLVVPWVAKVYYALEAVTRELSISGPNTVGWCTR